MSDLDKVDKILENLVDLAYEESENAVETGYFSKSLAEGCGLIISLAYGRWGKFNDK